MTSLTSDIETQSLVLKDHRGRNTRTIRDRELIAIGEKYHVTTSDVFIQSLKLGIVPLRYLRNQPSISLEEQIILAESEVAVVGSGGLGGHAIQLFTRLGVGRLLVFDPDTFDETNLNRQALCLTTNLETFKVEETVRQCAMINPAVAVQSHVMAITDPGQKTFFSNTDVIVDALDNADDRRCLAILARDLGIPMVHGAVAGFEGRVITLFPGDTGIETLYHPEHMNHHSQSSAEHILGTPALAPALIAPLQVMATLNILLQHGPRPHGQMIHVDLTGPDLNIFRV